MRWLHTHKHTLSSCCFHDTKVLLEISELSSTHLLNMHWQNEPGLEVTFSVWVCVLVVQSGLTFCYSMGYSLPGFSVHGIFQARILKRVAIPFSRGSSQPRDQTHISCIVSRFFTVWATREAQSFLFSLNIRTACYIIINMSTCYILSNIL